MSYRICKLSVVRQFASKKPCHETGKKELNHFTIIHWKEKIRKDVTIITVSHPKICPIHMMRDPGKPGKIVGQDISLDSSDDLCGADGALFWLVATAARSASLLGVKDCQKWLDLHMAENMRGSDADQQTDEMGNNEVKKTDRFLRGVAIPNLVALVLCHYLQDYSYHADAYTADNLVSGRHTYRLSKGVNKVLQANWTANPDSGTVDDTESDIQGVSGRALGSRKASAG
ncbi:unnamed protein product [Dibothriocephalus latus]|uniref:Uncharacterized protein n=1 Tax=Dibothriocephalus latus TaxID=60516 RepID=A0A3P7KXG9_DIBLA|nr:unnamed protein product [Dibothriocephalus latus]